MPERKGLALRPEVRAGRAIAQPPEGRPTSTTVIVAGLADPELVVEVEAIAIIG